MTDPIDSWVYKNLYILKYKQLESTNTLASNLLQTNALGGPSVILAEEQLLGRGQMQTKWHSSPNKNLLLSVVFTKLNLKISDQYFLNKVIGLAVLNALNSFSDKLKIKWPNDIYFQNKKLAGILVENQIQGEKIKNCIVGIGLNVNEINFPKSLPNPISLAGITKSMINLTSIESEFPFTVYDLVQKFLLRKDWVEEQYHNNLYRINEIHSFRDDKGEFQGIITYVNKNGQLIIQCNNTNRAYNNKEVKFL